MQILQNLSRHFFGECTHTETGGKRVGKARVTFAGSQLESLAHIDRAQTLLIIRVLPAALSHSLSLFYIFLGSPAGQKRCQQQEASSLSSYLCVYVSLYLHPWPCRTLSANTPRYKIQMSLLGAAQAQGVTWAGPVALHPFSRRPFS